MNESNMDFHAEKHPWSGGISLRMIIKGSDGERYIPNPVIMSKADEDQSIAPLMELSNQGAQRLIDELWSAGARPSEGSGSAGSLSATQRHLDDMKAIAFHVLKISKD